MSILKPGGRAAIVLPDNVLFEGHAGKEVRKLLLADCDLHTILRLPIGTFTPYSPGVKANILFFRKGLPTKEVWIYDHRTNIKRIAIRSPLTAEHFKDFEACYEAKPRKETERFRMRTIDQIREQDYNLDITWLKSETTDEVDELPDPSELVSESLTLMQTAVDTLSELSLKLGNGNGK